MPFRPLKPNEKPWDLEVCKDPEHFPPSMIVLPPGLHIWVCPSCGHEMPITVRNMTMGISTDNSEAYGMRA